MAYFFHIWHLVRNPTPSITANAKIIQHIIYVCIKVYCSFRQLSYFTVPFNKISVFLFYGLITHSAVETLSTYFEVEITKLALL